MNEIDDKEPDHFSVVEPEVSPKTVADLPSQLIHSIYLKTVDSERFDEVYAYQYDLCTIDYNIQILRISNTPTNTAVLYTQERERKHLKVSNNSQLKHRII